MSDPLAYIEAAHKRAEQTAQAAGGDGTPVWSTGRHHAVRDENDDAVAYDEGRPTPAQAAHIAANDPAAVLRRIGGERKLLAEHEAAQRVLSTYAEPDEATFAATEVVILGRVLRRIAEGWGWSEDGT